MSRLHLRLHLAATALWVVFGALFLVVLARPRAGPSDEIAHAVVFAGVTFSALASVELAGWPWARGRWVVAAIVLLAPVSELVQALRPGRTAQLSDVIADLVGVAVGASALAVWRAVRFRRSWLISGVGSLVAVALVMGVATVASVREAGWWRCRGQAWSPVAASVTGLEAGPLIELVGADAQWRWQDERWTVGEGVPQSSATSVWCGMVVARSFTAVVVVDADRLRAEFEERSLELFGSGTRSSGRLPNLEFEARGETLWVSLRGRTQPRVEFRSIGAFIGGVRWVAMRSGDGVVTVDVNEGRFLEQEVSLPFDLWALDLPLSSAADLMTPVDGASALRYVGLFDRALTDAELAQVLAALDAS